nr:PIG-L family deacetylase [Fortiea contorta]
MKKYLQQLQKHLPKVWIEKIQHFHSRLICLWISSHKNQILKFTQKSAMVFSPHQDDETFGCGGMIALKREYGVPVIVTFLTNGQGAANAEPNYQHKIIQTRKQEALTALQILGVEPSAIHFLEKPDGTLPDLTLEEKQQTIAQITALLVQHQPEEVYVPHHQDCHRDHEATYELVKQAIIQAKISVDLIEYPVWLFWRAPLLLMLKLSDIAATACFSIVSVQDKKIRAISSYHSQIVNLPRGFIQGFLGSEEIFFKSEF